MGKAAPVSNTSITALSPQIFVEIFQLLPLNQLAKVARLSRRFKVLSQQDAIYERHLGKLKMAGVLLVPKPDPLLNARDSLVARLCSLPEGQYLNLATGQAPSDLMTHSPIHDDAALNIPAASALASPSPVTSLPVTPSPTISIQEEEENQKIIAAYPDLKLSQLIIGSGGLKAALAQQKAKRKPSVANAPRISATSSNLIRIIPRDAFRQVYMELKPYYLDFECRQTESKVFKDFKDISKISAVLNKLQLLEKSGLLGTPNEDISFALQTAYEWFESTLLGHFEIAYDANNVYEMKRNAISAYYLNGGAAAVQLFISKNPVFFDESFNPSLIASKLPAVTGTSMGYALSDEFAKYMDHMLNNCKKQLEIVSHVFIPEMQAMTLFVNKVFEDSISEYLSSIIAAAKKREDLIVYLHTVASSIYTCFQFVDYLAQNNMNVSIDVEPVKDSIRDIFSAYFTSYIDDELKYLRKRYKSEIDKWDNRGAKSSKANAAAARESYLGDSKKAQEHKRYVMNTMKAIMFAPVALTSMVIEGVSGGKKPHQKSLLEDAEPITSDQFSPIRDNATYNLDDTSMNALLSLELVLNLMHTNKESLGRALVISSSLDISKLRLNVQKVYVALLKVIGDRHLKPAFTSAVAILCKSTPLEFVEGQKMVNYDSLQFFELIHIADLLQQMLDVYYTEDIRPWIDENDFLSEIMVEKKIFERILDDNVASGMDKAVQVLVNQCEYLLISAHNLNDYNPPNTGIFDWKPTLACTQVVKCLEAHTKLLSGVTEKHTSEVFFGEVGARLFSVLIKNIKRLQVSQTGAMQLICDLNKYHDWAASLCITSTTKLFQILKELGNLFLADGSEELRKLVHDAPRFQAALRVEEIYEILQSRTDYKSIQKHVEAKECIIQ